ncbi:MAG: LysE family translocator [Rhodospirillales bacterium]|nr:LysE family translocator [Rhodospirillales bacterium]
MPLELYLAYLAAAAVVLVIPGPTITLVVGYALAEGRRAAWATVAGVALGDLTAVTLSLAGLGALLAASATLFTAVKWAGAAYLVYLGIRLWRIEPAPDNVEGPAGRSPRKMLVHAWAVTSLNPKSIVFFVAFLPQFVASGHPVLPQLVILGASFVAMAALNAAGYAWLAGRARRAIARPGVLKLVNRIGGGILVGAGLATVAIRRA